jgi:hypothetical protein
MEEADRVLECEKLKESLKNTILNNNNIEKSFYDICNTTDCEYLLNGYFGIHKGQRKNTPEIKKGYFDLVLERDSKSYMDELDAHQQENGGRVEGVEFPFDTPQGKKEEDGKLYYELSWEFIEEMAKRMANNKSGKYPLYNWKKSIDVESLKQAINRHHVEVMKGNYQDGEEALGHIVSYACNSMMLWEQLNKK